MEEDVCLGKQKEPPGDDAEPPGTNGHLAAFHAVDLTKDPARFAPSLFSKPQKRNPFKPSSIHNGPRFPISPATDDFRRRCFPAVSEADWNDWRWQLRNRIHDVHSLSRTIQMSDAERDAISRRDRPLPLAITPYYASLLNAADPLQPLRRTVVPVGDEYRLCEGEAEDPLGEDHDSPVPGIVHRYPDRVLFLVTDLCSTYCRYCTRSRLVGKITSHRCSLDQWRRALAYIEKTPAIRDVLISGGDPLTLTNDRLEWLLSRIKRIPHVQFIRIGTKAPVVLPQRITHALTRTLRRYHPLWMSIHFTHPDEITPEVSQACNRLADAGIPLGSQTVLLSGVNDSVNVMKSLVQKLLQIRVRPYYLYQCDPIPGSSHFRTPVEKGIEIIHGLRGFTTGYAVPSYVIDAPGGGGKIPLLPEYYVGREGDFVLLRNYEGKIYRYLDPRGDVSGNAGTVPTRVDGRNTVCGGNT